MIDPCGTPARQVRVVDSTPGSLTCCVLPWRKLCIHCHKDLLMFLPLSLDKRTEWSTRSKALLKSINKEWMAFFPSAVFSESFNHVCVMFIRADTVERPWEKACWFSLTLKASSFRIICTLSRTWPRTGKTDICQKSVSRFSGGCTFGTGLTRACLYKVGYFLSRILALMISWTTTASSSGNLFKVQALILSEPVVFFELTWWSLTIWAGGGGWLFWGRAAIFWVLIWGGLKFSEPAFRGGLQFSGRLWAICAY